MTSSTAGPRPRNLRRILVAAIMVAFSGLACAALIFHLYRNDSTAPKANLRTARVPPDPRLTYKGPFTNVHPDVQYVGSAQCGKCHKEIAASYARHPMARTLIPIADLAPSQSYDQLHRNPFLALDAQFEVRRAGKQVWHRQTAPAHGRPA